MMRSFTLDRSTEKNVWTKFKDFFTSRKLDSIERTILEAREDGELEQEEGSMILRILHLDTVQVQDIMTPRTDFDCIPIGTSLTDVAKCITNSGHSRIPIYKETRDDIVGIAFAKDMLPLLSMPEHHNDPIDNIMRSPFFVPETKVVGELLQEFRARRNHMAIVVDEYGATSGLVTIEDLIEEIVGDIEDEHDAPKEEDIRVRDNGSLDLSGRALLEELMPHGITLDTDEVETIGGYLCLEAGHVPQAGEEFLLFSWRFLVVEADLKQIRRVLAEPPSLKKPSND